MTATTVTPTFTIGDTVEILRSQDPKITTYNGTEAEITGFSPKHWLKVKYHDGKTATLKPDWVSLKQSASVVAEAEEEVQATEVLAGAEPPESNRLVEPSTESESHPEPETAVESNNSIGYFKFSCDSLLLAKVVAQVRRVIRTMAIHPILSNIKITTDSETRRVELVGFDLSLGVIASITAKSVPISGSYTVSASVLGDIVSQLPEGEVTLERNESSPKVKLTTANGIFEMPGFDSYEFPQLPIPKTDITTVKVGTKVLRVGCGSVLYAASTDQTKMVLCGAHFVIKSDNKLEIAATDGHRLALYRGEVKSTTSDEDQHLTIPARSLREVERYLTNDEGTVEISYEVPDKLSGTSIIQFRLGSEAVIVTRLLEGEYPKYNDLIPKKFQREVWIERLPLISSIGRVAVLAAVKHFLIKISVEPKKITLYSEDEDTGSGTEAIPAEVSGEDVKIAFNIKYLSEALKNIGTQEVAIKINAPATPVIITPLNGYDIVALVMPVQVKS